MLDLTLEAASIIADETLRKGREMKFAPLTVVVLDAGGHMKVLKREDGCSLLRQQVAMGKAAATLGFGFGGRELARRAAKMPALFNSLTAMSDGNFVPLPGGVIIKNKDGRILGAVGVTGDVSENDELCALAGIEKAGLVADTGGE
ncbi:GlcG/HbpS family heme-binding protein [Oceanibaculum pacificum]|uniref:GlcG protein n=1 Tax=Oceanibaculum pacificum TaxID=580166 RepID=A0A154W2J3_9PROT|nr:heme-binding protein [Oceanibaculum pacificum]KZD07657.1 GlcG protein [Oceanibaculum pacificum]